MRARLDARREASGRPMGTTGLPEPVRSGIERLSGYSMADVRVHYVSPQPVAFHAHAVTQGADIHLRPGQEKHLAHEAWHVVQQKQGRVRPTHEAGGTAFNADPVLEREADVMGARAALAGAGPAAVPVAVPVAAQAQQGPGPGVVQAKLVSASGVPVLPGEVERLKATYAAQRDAIQRHQDAAEEYTYREARSGVIFAPYRPPSKAWTYAIPEGYAPTRSEGTVYDAAKSEGLKMNLKRKKMPSSFTDTLLEQPPGTYSYAGSEKVEETGELKRHRLARTHHLADSAIRAVIEYLHKNRAWTTTQGGLNRVRQWMGALTYGQGTADTLFGRLLEATSSTELEEVIDALSNNPWNVGIGQAEPNTRHGPFFDESLTTGGFATPMSSVIAQYTEYLAESRGGPIPDGIIKAALSQLVEESTGEVSRSMEASLDTSGMPGPGLYSAGDLSNEQLVAMVDRALSRNTAWAVTLVEQSRADISRVLYLLRAHNYRFVVTPKGDVVLRLRGG